MIKSTAFLLLLSISIGLIDIGGSSGIGGKAGIGGGASSIVLPTVFNYTSLNWTRGDGPTANGVIRTPLPYGAQSGNALICLGSADGSVTVVPSATDDKGNSWTGVNVVNDTTNGQFGLLWYARNVIAGTRVISLKFSTSGQAANITGWCGEANGVHPSAAPDFTVGNFGTSASITASSGTPTVTGDLILHWGWRDGSPKTTGLTPGSQANITWHFASTDTFSGIGVQWGQYNSTSAINPTFSTASSTSFVSVAVAFKTSNGQGSPQPGGMRVVGNTHYHFESATDASPFTTQLACQGTGKLLIAEYVSGNRQITGINDSVNTWTQAGVVANSGANDSQAQIWYAQNATCSDTLKPVITTTGSASQDSVLLYDVAGASASSFDSSQSPADPSATGTQSVLANLLVITMTPSTATGIIFHCGGVGSNTVNGFVDSTQTFMGATYDGEGNNSFLDENNAWGFQTTTTNSSRTFTWTFQDGSPAAGIWAAKAAHFF